MSEVTPDAATEGDTEAQAAIDALDQVDVDAAEDAAPEQLAPEVLEGTDGGVEPAPADLEIDADDDPDDGLDDGTDEDVPDVPLDEPDAVEPDAQVVPDATNDSSSANAAEHRLEQQGEQA